MGGGVARTRTRTHMRCQCHNHNVHLYLSNFAFEVKSSKSSAMLRCFPHDPLPTIFLLVVIQLHVLSVKFILSCYFYVLWNKVQSYRGSPQRLGEDGHPRRMAEVLECLPSMCRPGPLGFPASGSSPIGLVGLGTEELTKDSTAHSSLCFSNKSATLKTKTNKKMKR